MRRLFIFSLLFVATTALAHLDRISHQGFLTRPNGTPLDTTVSITFKLYRNVGGTYMLAWQETHPAVAVSGGHFHVELGTFNPIPKEVVDHPDVQLGTTVGNNSEMTPRKDFNSVLYSYWSQGVSSTMEDETLRVMRGLVYLSDPIWSSTMTAESSFVGRRDYSAGVIITGDGEVESVRDYQVVAGFDTSGGVFGGEFRVVDSNGIVRAIIQSDGTIRNGIAGNGHTLSPNGTWQSFNNGDLVAGLDPDFELFAKSFYTRDPQTGDTIVHITFDGQILVNGENIAGSEIVRTFQGDTTVLNGIGFSTYNGVSNSSVQPDRIETGLNNGTAGHTWLPNGTWFAEQGNQVVAGLDANGEIFAKSFYVRDPATGDTLLHLTNRGHLQVDSNVTARAITGTSLNANLINGIQIVANSVVGNTQNFVETMPTYTRARRYVNGVLQSGWIFNTDGSMNQYINGVPNMAVANNGYTFFDNRVYLGPQAEENYLYWQTGYNGIQVNGDMRINGKLDVTGAVDPIIAERFTKSEGYSYERGTVIVADPNSDRYIPCSAAYQKSVVGVVSPDDDGKYGEEVLAVILGAAASPDKDGKRLEVRVKADARFGAIKRGDLLTTSTTVGHAMLASEPKIGTIVGKALESLPNGQGEIKVMVTLN